MSSTSRSRPRSRAARPDVAEPDQPEVSGLDAHVGYWLRAVSNHVSHAFKAKVERHGVTVAEWVVLRALLDGDGVKPSALATTLGLTRGAISKLVDRLVAKELVSIQSDATDGRSHLVTLKPSGRRLIPKLAALADENDEEAFGHLDPAQREALLATLKLVVGHLGLRGAPVD